MDIHQHELPGSRRSVPFGDLKAPTDSAAYAVAVKMHAQACLNSHEQDVEELDAWVTRLREADRYQMLGDENGVPYRDWQRFCTTRQPYGLGYSPTAIEQIIRERRKAQELAAAADVPPEAPHGGARPGAGRPAKQMVQALDPEPQPAPLGDEQHHAENQPSVRRLKQSYGETAEYLVRRLKRDAPKVAAQLAEGAFPSARAAAKAAGIVREKSRVEKANALCSTMTDDELIKHDTFVSELLRSRNLRRRRRARQQTK